MKKKAAAAGALLAIALSGCSLSGATHQSANAGQTNHGPADVAQMPSGFRNLAYKCVTDHVTGRSFEIFSASDGGNGDNLAGAVSAVQVPRC